MKLKNFSNIVRLIVTVLLVMFIYRFFNIQLDELLRAIASSDKTKLWAAFSLMPLILILQMTKWYQLLKIADENIRFSDAASSLLAGMTLGIITPARLGELGRAWFLKDVPQLKVVGLTLADKFYSTLAYFIWGLLSLIVFFNLNYSPALSANILMIAGSLFVYMLIVVSVMFPRKVGKTLITLNKFLFRREQIVDISLTISNLKRGKIFLLLGLATSVWFLVVTELWLLVNAFSDVGFLPGTLSASSAHFTKTLLPLTFGELGVREAATIYFFKNLGVSEVASVASALLMFSMNVLLPSLVGTLFLRRLKIGREITNSAESLTQVQKEEE